MANETRDEALHSPGQGLEGGDFHNHFAPQGATFSIPRAGGAFRGLHEKLDVNSASGTCSLTVPLSLTKDRNGSHPELKLRYDSSNGNGAFGIGWSLGLPQISRKTTKEVPNFSDADVFTFRNDSQHEDLIMLNSPDPLSVHKDFIVQSFEPVKCTSLFRLQRWIRRLDPSDVHWKCTTGNNVTLILGGDEKSRILRPGTTDIFSWLISSTLDCHGHAEKYNYRAEDGVNVGKNKSYEHHRSNSASKYIESIAYGNVRPVHSNHLINDCKFHLEVFFNYGNLDPFETAAQLRRKENPNDDWICRQDPFSTCRSSFEIRSYRLCESIIILHHFEKELGQSHCLVRAWKLTYYSNNRGSQLKAIGEAGFDRDKTKCLPLINFNYSTAQPFEKLKSHLVPMTFPCDAPEIRMMDLDGSGMPDLLLKQSDEWHVKKNYSTTPGELLFGAWKTLESRPALKNGKLLDYDGDGHLEYIDRRHGYFRLRNGRFWDPFHAFSAVPSCDLESTSVRLVDLTGDGTGDVLEATSAGYIWYGAQRDTGFGSPSSTSFAESESQSLPTLGKMHPDELLYLADMSGDGLQDLVRVRNGSICYWSNLGHGKFGRMIEMHNPPFFEGFGQFSHTRLRLQDVDGSGPCDLVYFPSDGGIHVYYNESGNSWGEASIISFPAVRKDQSLLLADLFGSGTLCALLFSPTNNFLVYVDICGGQKPRLLTSLVHDAGKEYNFRYNSSSQLNHQDIQKGNKPWDSTLPFPVQCVSEITINDRVSGSEMRRSFRYRNGYYDSKEREFVGFSYVEELIGHQNESCSLLIKSWFHDGISDSHLDHVELLGHDIQGDLVRQALRSIRGALIRKEETKAGCPRFPISTDEHKYQVVLQNIYAGRGSFRVNLTQTKSSAYEWQDNPRVWQYNVLSLDVYGNVLKSVEVYNANQKSNFIVQQQSKSIMREFAYTEPLDTLDGFRGPTLYQSCAYAMQGNSISSSPDNASFSKKLISHEETIFRSDDLSGDLDIGRVGMLGLVAYEAKLAFTGEEPALLAKTFLPIDFHEGGYVDRKGNGSWWLVSGRQYFSSSDSEDELSIARSNFFKPARLVDQFNNTHTLTYDESMFNVQCIQGPDRLKTEAKYDYRHLQIQSLEDPNGNSRYFTYDSLGNLEREIPIPKGAMLDIGPGIDFAIDIQNLPNQASVIVGKSASLSFVDTSSLPCKIIRIENPLVLSKKSQKSHHITISYLNGCGEVWRTSQFIEDGKWLQSGPQTYDSRGNVVHQYQPLFHSKPDLSSALVGVPFTTIWDSLSRPVLEIRGDGAWKLHQYDAWSIVEYDYGDTIGMNIPQHLGSDFAKLDRHLRKSSNLQDEIYSQTPRTILIDGQGKRAGILEEPGKAVANHIRSICTRSTGDLEETVHDSKGRLYSTILRNLIGHVYHSQNLDAGSQYILRSVDSYIIRDYRGEDNERRFRFDSSRRPTEDLSNTKVVVSRIYGIADDSCNNGIGRLASVQDETGKKILMRYDMNGMVEVSRLRLNIRGNPRSLLLRQELSMQQSFDYLGRKLTQIYPNGQELVYEYDNLGNLKCVKGIVDEITYTTHNHISQIVYRNGCTLNYTYSNETQELEAMRSRVGDREFYRLLYQRDVTCRITKIEESLVVGGDERKIHLASQNTYSYDALGRLLTSLNLGSGTGLQSLQVKGALRHSEIYDYDSEHNLISLKHDSTDNHATRKFRYAEDSNRLRLVEDNDQEENSIFSGSNGSIGLPSRVDGLALEWTSAQKIRRVQKIESPRFVEYYYDYEGSRTLRHVSDETSRTEETAFIDNLEVTFEYSSDREVAVCEKILVYSGCIPLARIVSKRTSTDDPKLATNFCRFIVPNHLFSVTLELDEQAAIKSYECFAPYGESNFRVEDLSTVRESGTKQGFIGNSRDDETGLTFCQHRDLSTRLCRWLAPDPAGMVDGTNLYAYVTGDPINLADYDGLEGDPPSQFPRLTRLLSPVGIATTFAGFALLRAVGARTGARFGHIFLRTHVPYGLNAGIVEKGGPIMLSSVAKAITLTYMSKAADSLLSGENREDFEQGKQTAVMRDNSKSLKDAAGDKDGIRGAYHAYKGSKDDNKRGLTDEAKQAWKDPEALRAAVVQSYMKRYFKPDFSSSQTMGQTQSSQSDTQN